MTNPDHFLKLPLTPGRGFDDSGKWLEWRFTNFDSSKGIFGCFASWWICIDLMSGAVILQRGHSSLAWPPFSWPDLSASPAFPPPRFVVAASIFDAISLAVCFFGFAFPVIVIYVADVKDLSVANTDEKTLIIHNLRGPDSRHRTMCKPLWLSLFIKPHLPDRCLICYTQSYDTNMSCEHLIGSKV